ncbi:MAG: nuclear transport factor 2 family protein [Sphingobacteriales bacterium]|nr:MAG: nuclear transport factor 2 family protein [Sphingobacteriales bacterium]
MPQGRQLAAFFTNQMITVIQQHMTNEAAIMMEDNLTQVWNERDPALRLQAIGRLYTGDASLYHVGEQVSGPDAINNSVSATQKMLPEHFVFTRLKPVVINNDIGRLIWGAGPAGQSPVATGMDVAQFENGRIKSLYVFLDKE